MCSREQRLLPQAEDSESSHRVQADRPVRFGARNLGHTPTVSAWSNLGGFSRDSVLLIFLSRASLNQSVSGGKISF